MVLQLQFKLVINILSIHMLEVGTDSKHDASNFILELELNFIEFSECLYCSHVVCS